MEEEGCSFNNAALKQYKEIRRKKLRILQQREREKNAMPIPPPTSSTKRLSNKETAFYYSGTSGYSSVMILVSKISWNFLKKAKTQKDLRLTLCKATVKRKQTVRLKTFQLIITSPKKNKQERKL